MDAHNQAKQHMDGQPPKANLNILAAFDISVVVKIIIKKENSALSAERADKAILAQFTLKAQALV